MCVVRVRVYVQVYPWDVMGGVPSLEGGQLKGILKRVYLDIRESSPLISWGSVTEEVTVTLEGTD